MLGLGLGLTCAYRQGGSSFSPLDLPAWMTWDPGITISATSSGQTRIDVEPESFNVAGQNPSATVRYVNVTTGNDSTLDGTSPTVDGGGVGPYRSITKAVADAKALDGSVTDFIIYVAAGTYDRRYFWPTGSTAFPATMNISIIATGGDVYLSSQFEPLSWSVASGSIYTATRSAVSAIWDSADLDADGYWTRLELVGTSAGDITGPGQWAQSGSTIWVWLDGDRAPDSDCRVMLAGTTVVSEMVGTFYSENIWFFGSINALIVNGSTLGTCKQAFNGGGFCYATSGNGLDLNGTDGCYLFGVSAFRNYRDGLNYHETSGGAKQANVFEYNVTSRANGMSGDTNNNASSMHDAGQIIRVGGSYSKSEGPNVPDVGGSLSWLVGCTASESVSSTQKGGYLFSDGGKAQLDYCRSVGNTTYDIAVDVTNSTEVTVNNWLGENTPPVYLNY